MITRPCPHFEECKLNPQQWAVCHNHSQANGGNKTMELHGSEHYRKANSLRKNKMGRKPRPRVRRAS